MTASDDEDEKLELSSHALSALKDFYNERDAHQKQFEALKDQIEADDSNRKDGAAATPLTMAAFAEDWNSSQFWYSQATADTLANSLLDNATAQDAIAFVSVPSAFLAAKNILAHMDPGTRPEIVLLEYDERFDVFAEFVRYDFNKPLAMPARLKGKFSAIIADPPFLNDECQTKTALTVQWLARATGSVASSGLVDTRLAVCTGERMSGLIQRLYGKKGVRMTDYEVQHEKGLSNEFRLYANLTNEHWQFAAPDANGAP